MNQASKSSVEKGNPTINKIAIVYWSRTGNTEIMAQCIAEGVKDGGSEAALLSLGDFSAARLAEFSAVAFGCPAMGSEVLEESEFDPMFTDLECQLTGKRIALFGSYGWGKGQWMRDWCKRCENANLFNEEGLMLNETPDDAGREACRALGQGLAGW